MELHHVKTKATSLEAIVTVGLEIVEDLMKLKLSKLAKLLFAAKGRKIALMEAEIAAPGSQLAYIVTAKKAFAGHG